MKTKLMKFQLVTYELIGDGEGGVSVNDAHLRQVLEVKARLTKFNVGTGYDSSEYTLSDMQLNRAVNEQGLTWEGELGHTLYATTKRGNPACELRRVAD